MQRDDISEIVADMAQIAFGESTKWAAMGKAMWEEKQKNCDKISLDEILWSSSGQTVAMD